MICKKFELWTLSRQFARISIRFSPEGFEKLGFLVERPHIAKHVKKFSYMVPSFSSLGNQPLCSFCAPLNRVTEAARFVELLSEAKATTLDLQRQLTQRQNVPHVDRLRPTNHELRARRARSENYERLIAEVMRRTDIQRGIIKDKIDEKALVSALKAFTRLQQIRLMRVQDPFDAGWNNFSRAHLGLQSESRPARWTLACEHAARTLGRAFLVSQSPVLGRISCRSLDPRTPLLLAHGKPKTISDVAVRLNCLELQFDDRPNLDDDLLELSRLFQTGFTAAVNIEGLHIGFTRPVTISFKTIFHNVHWKKLKYIGFGAWRLDSEEIIDFVRRHQKSLRSIRLRDVRLNDGSRWVEVLRVLRLELTNLKWVSLRKVGYSDEGELGGLYVPDQQDDDDDSDGSNWGVGEGTSENFDENEEEDEDEVASLDEDAHDDGHGDESGESTHGSVAGDSELGTAVNDLAIDDQTMLHHSTAPSDNMSEERTADSVSNTPLQCECDNGFAWEDLVDDGSLRVPKLQWKWWEKWVINRCQAHDPAPSS